MSDTTLSTVDLSAMASPLETDVSSESPLRLQQNPDGTVSVILSPELEAGYQAIKRGRALEAQRLKARLSQVPFYAQRAAARGEKYWDDLASTYQGSD